MTQPFGLLKETSKVKYRPEALEDKDKDHKIDTIDKDTESGSGVSPSQIEEKQKYQM
jgi:hypothetical protein